MTEQNESQGISPEAAETAFGLASNHRGPGLSLEELQKLSDLWDSGLNISAFVTSDGLSVGISQKSLSSTPTADSDQTSGK